MGLDTLRIFENYDSFEFSLLFESEHGTGEGKRDFFLPAATEATEEASQGHTEASRLRKCKFSFFDTKSSASIQKSFIEFRLKSRL